MLINSLREWASLAIQLLLAIFLMGVIDAVVKPLYEPEYMEITMDSASRDFIVSLPVIPASSQLPGFPQLLFWTTAACFLTRWGLRKLQRPPDPKSWWAGRLRTSVPYAPEEHIIASLLRLEGTSIQMVLFKPLFWILLLVHIILRHVNDKFTPLPSLDATVLVGLPSSLLIFLVVFYGDRCYQRYYELWGHVSALNAMVYNWVLQTGFIYSPLEMGQAQLDKIAPRLTVSTTAPLCRRCGLSASRPHSSTTRCFRCLPQPTAQLPLLLMHAYPSSLLSPNSPSLGSRLPLPSCAATS